MELTQTNHRTGKVRKIRGRNRGKPITALKLMHVQAETIRDPKLLDALQACLVTKPKQLGTGRDHKYATAWSKVPAAKRKMQVQQAWRIQNAGLSQKYKAGVMTIAGHTSKVAPTWKVNQVRKELTQAAADLAAQDDDLEELRPEVNEAMLVTGVPPEVVMKIIEQGFNERFSGNNAGTMFGDGTYFVSDSCCSYFCHGLTLV